jgi:hypothetical protein
LIDWDGRNSDWVSPLGWSNVWTKQSHGANFPEFVYPGFDSEDEKPGIFEQKKKRLKEEHADEISFEAQGQIDWHIEIG